MLTGASTACTNFPPLSPVSAECLKSQLGEVLVGESGQKPELPLGTQHGTGHLPPSSFPCGALPCGLMLFPVCFTASLLSQEAAYTEGSVGWAVHQATEKFWRECGQMQAGKTKSKTPMSNSSSYREISLQEKSLAAQRSQSCGARIVTQNAETQPLQLWDPVFHPWHCWVSSLI